MEPRVTPPTAGPAGYPPPVYSPNRSGPSYTLQWLDKNYTRYIPAHSSISVDPNTLYLDPDPVQ